MPVATKKDVAKSIKTLIVMLQSMKNQQVSITLRNDSVVRGTIVKVDSNMNVELMNVIIEPDPFYCTAEGPSDGPSNLIPDKIKYSTDTVINNNMIAQRKDTNHVDPSILNQEEEDHDVDDGEMIDANDSLAYLIVKGSRIRHIDVPENFDVMANTKQEIERMRGRTKQWTKQDIVR